MFDIYLVRPSYHTHLITPVLGLGYIASSLKAAGFTAKIIDGVNMGISNEQIVRNIPPKSLVGIMTLSAYFQEAAELAKLLKDKDCVIIVGGPHATCLPKHALENTVCDYVIVGEGEQIVVQLIQSLKKQNEWPDIQGVYHRHSKTVSKAPQINNLDEIPFPDWEQMNPNLILKAPHGGIAKNYPIGVIMTTRGCPFGCTFCASSKIWDNKIRFRSPQNVLDEIEYLIAKFGVKEIHFEDDNLTLTRSHIEEICRGIIERNLKISWATPNGIRADKIDRELLTLMKKSGCYAVAFGIESANPEILHNIKKSESIETITQAIDIAHELGLITQGFFIFGLPGETLGSARHTINYANQSKLDKAQFLILEILPGSEIYNHYATGHQEKYDDSFKGYNECTVSICELTPQQLKELQTTAFRTFFFNPSRIMTMLSNLRLSQLKFVFMRIKDFYLHAAN